MKNVALILCGSGFKDGSEIRESVAALWALSVAGVEVKIFSPDQDQLDVINCLTGEVMKGDSRNQRVESARIARGQVDDIKTLQPHSFAALVIPGGFGAAKNLCTFALQGSNATVHPEVARVVRAFHAQGKPIGAICIAPAILALTLPTLELTFGLTGDASRQIESLGHKHVETRVDECHVDKKNKVVTTAAYMYDQAPLAEVFTGIDRLVKEVLNLAR